MKRLLLRFLASATLAFVSLLLYRLGFAVVASLCFCAIGAAAGLEIIFLFR